MYKIFNTILPKPQAHTDHNAKFMQFEEQRHPTQLLRISGTNADTMEQAFARETHSHIARRA